ncbi:MAG: HAD-IA family hydrolase [Lysobacterales bacterium]
MSRIAAVLFDLDGTLLDSAPDLVGSLNQVRQSESLPPLALQQMKRFASHGAVGLLKAGMPETDAATFEKWRQRFLKHYAQNSYRHSSLFDGVPALLEYLGREGIPWGIVTNKVEALTLPIIEAANLADSVACVVCGDTLAECKPHPAPVSLACGIVKVAPGEALMVGDDVRDIAAGRAAGTQTAAVFYGYGSDELESEVVNGSYRVHHPADLVDLIERTNGAK